MLRRGGARGASRGAYRGRGSGGRPRLVLIGGFLADGTSSHRVDFYAPSSDTWRSGPDLPAGVNHVLGGYGAERSAFVPTRKPDIHVGDANESLRIG